MRDAGLDERLALRREPEACVEPHRVGLGVQNEIAEPGRLRHSEQLRQQGAPAPLPRQGPSTAMRPM